MASKTTKTKQKTPKRHFFRTKNVSNEDEGLDLDDEFDPCKEKDDGGSEEPCVITTPGIDPRFQQQNQTNRCYIMYTDFYQCEYLLGEGAEACTWFKQVFTSICPQDWVERWDDYRNENRMPWFKRVRNFPEHEYGK